MNRFQDMLPSPSLLWVAANMPGRRVVGARKNDCNQKASREDGRLESQKTLLVPDWVQDLVIQREGKGKGLTAIWTNSLAGPITSPLDSCFWGGA